MVRLHQNQKAIKTKTMEVIPQSNRQVPTQLQRELEADRIPRKKDENDLDRHIRSEEAANLLKSEEKADLEVENAGPRNDNQVEVDLLILAKQADDLAPIPLMKRNPKRKLKTNQIQY